MNAEGRNWFIVDYFDGDYEAFSNLSTPEGFFWLWGKMRTPLPAANKMCLMPAEFQVINSIDNPDNFANAVYDFLRKEKDG